MKLAAVSLCLVVAGAAAGSAWADSVPVAAPAAADRFAGLRAGAERIAGILLVDGKALDLLDELSDTVGARLTGSPGYTRGAEWAAAKMRAFGLENVHLEPFTLEHGWQRGVARARVVAPAERPLHVESQGWVPATPKGGVRGPILVVTDIEPAALQPLLAGAKGKIVVLDRARGGPRPTGPRRAKMFLNYRKAIAALKDAGALAVLSLASPDTLNNAVGTGAAEWGGKIGPLPVAAIGREDGTYLVRAAERGPVTVELELPNKVLGAVQVPNVVGELRGTAAPDDWILVGAHLDSWDFATGSQDNGAGVVQVLDVARALAAAGKPKRTVRFALWAGEEQGLNGSRAYAQAHAAELARCVAVLNTDNGAGHVKGWKVEARKDVRAALEPISKGLLRGAGGSDLEMTLSSDTDHFPFVLAGVPALDLLVDMKKYEEVHHMAADTVDKVDAHDLASGAVVVAVTAYALASTTDAFAPHLDQAAVGGILKEEGLDEILRVIGVWK